MSECKSVCVFCVCVARAQVCVCDSVFASTCVREGVGKGRGLQGQQQWSKQARWVMGVGHLGRPLFPGTTKQHHTHLQLLASAGCTRGCISWCRQLSLRRAPRSKWRECRSAQRAFAVSCCRPRAFPSRQASTRAAQSCVHARIDRGASALMGKPGMPVYW